MGTLPRPGRWDFGSFHPFATHMSHDICGNRINLHGQHRKAESGLRRFDVQSTGLRERVGFRRALLRESGQSSIKASSWPVFCLVESSGPNLLIVFVGVVGICSRHDSSNASIFSFSFSERHLSLTPRLVLHQFVYLFREKWMDEMWRSHCSRDHSSLLQSVLPPQSVDGGAREAACAICGVARGSGWCQP